MSRFTWNIQRAGYDHEKYDDMGETTYGSFIEEFERFPWIEQMESRNKMGEGCSATLSVKDLETGCDFWVSIAGDTGNYGYLIGYVHPKEVRGFFGLGKAKTKRWCEIYLTENVTDIKKYFELFFARKSSDLEDSIRRLDKFGEMEAGGIKLV